MTHPSILSFRDIPVTRVSLRDYKSYRHALTHDSLIPCRQKKPIQTNK